MFSCARCLIRVLIMGFIASCSGSAQVAVGLSSGSASLGATIGLNLSLTAAATAPAALEWTLEYPTTDFSSVTLEAGPAAVASSKNISCNDTAGLLTCILWGMNATPILNGIIATVGLTASTSAAGASSPLHISNVVAADAGANSLLTSSAGGTITFLPGLYGFSCSPVVIAPPNNSSCVLKLTSAALSGGATVSLSSSPPYPSVPASVTIPEGTSSGSFTVTPFPAASATSVTLTASYSGVHEGFGLTVDPARATRLAFSAVPSTAMAGKALSPAVAVRIEDGSGNLVNSNALVSINSSPAGLSASAQAVNGIATFNNLVLNIANSYTLTASSSGLSSATSAITIGPAAATRLAFTTPPANGSAGLPMTPVIVVKVEDSFGNLVNGNPVVAISSMPAGVSGTTSATALNGVATFTNLKFNLAASYTLTATLPGIPSTSSGSFTISPGMASKLVFAAQLPSSGTAGAGFGAIVQVQDVNGNLATGSNIPVTIDASTTGLTGTMTVTAVNGVATFNNLVLNTPGSYILTASFNGLASAISTPITIRNQIILPANPTVVGVGMSALFPVTLAAPAPSGGAIVMLTSSDVEVTLRPANILIPGGATAPARMPQVNGINFGSAVITASAFGF